MSVIAARIDNRLLHGIVATQWVPEYKPQRLMVIDNEYADDPTKKAGMRMAKPAGVALSIINEQTALANFKAGKYNDHTVFIVARSPETILRVMETGQAIPSLIIGGTVTPGEGVEATQVSRRAFVRADEIDTYRSIAAKGCALTVQYVPSDKSEPLSNTITL